MPTPCVIRFTDDDGEGQVYVHRRDHGHPEEVITNLSYLNGLDGGLGAIPSPGSIAAKFVVLDAIWYAVWEIPRGELEEKLWEILLFPNRVTKQDEGCFLHHHTILDTTDPIGGVEFLYEVEIGESEWQVKIGHNSDSKIGRVNEEFEKVSWGFSDSLSEAEGQF